jgi:hypothetical protein
VGQETDEFVIKTPTLMTIKYWPGIIVFVATHPVSMARVIIGAEDHEVHIFAFPRSTSIFEDGKAMLDIELDDIEHDLSPEQAQITAAVLHHQEFV